MKKITLIMATILLFFIQANAQIACNAEINVSLDLDGNAYITADMVVEGNSGAGYDSILVFPYFLDCTDIGQVEITVVGIDYDGENDECSTLVTIEDKTPPVVVGEDHVDVNVSNGAVMITTEMLDDGSYDNCSMTMSASPAFVDCNSENPTIATLSVTDNSGNTNNVMVTLNILGTVEIFDAITCYNPQYINVISGPWELTVDKIVLAGASTCVDDYGLSYVNVVEGNITPSNNIFTIDHVGETYEVTVVDFISSLSCITEITIVAAGDNFNFCVTDFDGAAISDVKFNEANTTDETGCVNVTEAFGQSIVATKEDDQTNGVDMIDALMMRMYILAQSTVTADQDFAGDINGNGIVSTLDIVLLEKMLLGEYDFDQVWYFYDANDPIDYNTLPQDVNSTIITEEGQLNYSFNGIKKGDLDLSYGQIIEDIDKTDLQVKDIVLNTNESYFVDLFIDDNAAFFATDLQLIAETEEYEILNITSSLSDYSFDKSVHIIDGKANLYWLASEQIILEGGSLIDAGSAIFTVEIRAKQNGILSNTFVFSENDGSKWFQGENGMETEHIKLEIVDKITVPIFQTTFSDNLIISPNPSSDYIVLETDKAMTEATYSIYSLSGMLMNQGKLPANNTIDIMGLTTGIYQLTLKTTNSLYAQKLSVIR